GQRRLPTGLLVEDRDSGRVEWFPLVRVEAADPEVGRHHVEAELVAALDDEAVDDRETSVLLPRRPDVPRVPVAAGDRTEPERGMGEERAVEAPDVVLGERTAGTQLSRVDGENGLARDDRVVVGMRLEAVVELTAHVGDRGARPGAGADVEAAAERGDVVERRLERPRRRRPGDEREDDEREHRERRPR